MRNLRVGLCGLVLVAMGRVGFGALADRVPADAVAFIEWRGTDALGGEYAHSHVKGMVDALGVEKWVKERMENAAGAGTDAALRERREVLEAWMGAAMKSETGVYVGPVDFSEPSKPMPKVAIFSKMGNAAAVDLAKRLTAVRAQEKGGADRPFAAVAVGDFLLVTIGADMDMEKRLSGAIPADGLGETEAYKAAMGQLGGKGGDSAAVMYGSGEAALRVLDDAIETRAANGGRRGAMNARMWPRVETAMGLDEIQQIAFAGNFDGADWRTEGFIGLGEKRAGLVGFLDSGALPAEVYGLVPATATWANAVRFDGGRFLDDIRNAAGEVGGNGQRQFDSALQQFFAWTGVDLKKDLLGSMGDAFVFYGEPDGAGKSLRNFTMVSKLKDVARAASALNTLEGVVNAMAGQRNPNTKIQFKTEPLAVPNEKTMAHVLALETMTPTWAIADGVLYFSLSKEGVEGAIAGKGKKGTIVKNAAYARLREKLGQKEIATFGFADLPGMMPEAYEFAEKGLGEARAAHQEGVGDYALPPLETLMPNVGPSLEVTWADKAGWHMKATGALPVVNGVGPEWMILRRRIRGEIEKASATQPGGTTRAGP